MEYRIVSAEGGRTVVECSGRLTFSNSTTFMRVAEELKATGGDDWVFDLSGLEFIDSAGLGMLLMARDMAGQQNGRMALRGAAGQVEKALSLARFDELIPTES
ncbi:STAS domain protein [mine drainage metagenome]|uniref:STAS domain protein n=1 Tax=mine drainage metagenome TaxID=410659 RepID=A0A1J5RA00_9ZZZZ